MDEGVLGHLLGGEEEEAEAEDLVAGDDALVAAATLEARRDDPDFTHKLTAYVDRHAHLIEIQTEHLHEQRAVQLSHLKIRRFTDWLKAATQIFIILTACLVCLSLMVMLYDASTSRSVVVEAFKAPAVLAGRGVTGQAVASSVLDTLQKLNDATRSASKSMKTRSAWASDIRVEVPETGVSIGEIDHLLHQRFGHDLHIDGDLMQTDAGALALNIRGDGVPASTFTGGAGDLDALTARAAEYVYGRAQPLQYAVYLINNNRSKDALAFVPGAFARAATDDERAQLALTWGAADAAQNRTSEALDKWRLEMTLAPRASKAWWMGWSNIIAGAQDEETTWRESQAFLRAASEAHGRRRPELRLLSTPAGDTWDLPLEMASGKAEAALNNGAGSRSYIIGPGMAELSFILHDTAQSARYLASSNPDDPDTKAVTLLLQGRRAIERGDVAGAIAPLQRFYEVWLADPNLQAQYPEAICSLGFAYASTGRMAKAQAVFKRVSHPLSVCNALQGDGLAQAGDIAGASRLWAAGLKRAPDLPMIYLHRGQFELDHGDLKAAAADLSTANAKAPHFADPLKAWGDLLAKQGLRKLALAKYDDALKYAPAWADLHQARDAAARKG